MMGDDGEKFGAWPTTWEHCWGERRWVERFFEALEANADWLTTTTPSAWLDGAPADRPRLRADRLYAEMGEWALPADESLRLPRRAPRGPGGAPPGGALAARRVLAQLPGQVPRDQRPPQADAADLGRGRRDAGRAAIASARSTTSTRASRTTATGTGCSAGSTSATCGSRRYEHLIAAEDLAEPAAGRARTMPSAATSTSTGSTRSALADAGQVVTIDLDEGAGIGGWDIRAARHALAAVMRRRPEAYHETLARSSTRPTVAGRARTRRRRATAPASIHDIVRVKEPGLAARLHYDPYERRSGLVRVPRRSGTTPEAGRRRRAIELGDAVDGRVRRSLELGAGGLVAGRDAARADAIGARPRSEITKTVALGGDRRSPTLTLDGRPREPIRTVQRSRRGSGIEWTLTMLGGGGNPAAWWEVGGDRGRPRRAPGRRRGLTRIAQGNDYIGVAVATTVSSAADAWWAPVETVSNSEAGFERVYQGSAAAAVVAGRAGARRARRSARPHD